MCWRRRSLQDSLSMWTLREVHRKKIIQNLSLRLSTSVVCFSASAHLMQINPAVLSNSCKSSALSSTSWVAMENLSNSPVAKGQSLVLANCGCTFVLYLNIYGNDDIINTEYKCCLLLPYSNFFPCTSFGRIQASWKNRIFFLIISFFFF